jgi:Ser/Thr protein kinase RdoA (MazF antagonist)
MNLDEPNADRSVIGTALRRLGWDPLGLGSEFQRLADGQSGSMVWRIDLDGQPLVLKVTSSTSKRDLLVRAEREVDFYRDLAHRVPVRVPHCIGMAVGGDGVALLVAAEAPALPLADWTEGDFQRVAHDLGRLHGTFWGETGIETLPGWLRQSSSVTAEHAVVVEARWRELVVPSGSDSLRENMFHLVLQVPALNRQFAILPPTLCHGDAHRDNLLQAETGE